MSSIPTVLAGVAALSAWAAAAQGVTITDPGQGPVNVTGGGEFSGLTRLSALGDDYLAVSDSAGGNLYPLTIQINPATGYVTNAPAAGPPINTGLADLEAIAWDGNANIVVADESTPTVTRRHAATGALIDTLSIPANYAANGRTNRKLESLTRDPTTSGYFFANEEALVGDGQTTTPARGIGTSARITDSLTGRQYGYVIDPPADNPLASNEQAGLVELLALPNGTLLALEREASLGLIARIYALDFTHATDVSAIAALDSDDDGDLDDESAFWTPVAKSLLWSHTSFSFTLSQVSNYEAMALGPALDTPGSYSLLLLSDNGNGLAQTLYPLIIHGVPEPATALWLTCAVAILTVRRRDGSRRAAHR